MLSPEMPTTAAFRHAVLLFAVVTVAFAFDAQVATAAEEVPIIDHFKHGSIGSERTPYLIWKVLPAIFPEYLPQSSPQDYGAFGFLPDPGTDLPIGFTKRTVQGVDLVGLNCAACHVGTVRENMESKPRIVLGMPAISLDLGSYFSFFSAVVSDERFTVDEVMTRILMLTKLNDQEAAAYRKLVEQTKQAFIERGRTMSFLNREYYPAFGPGRVDTFNPYKAIVFRFDMENDRTIGVADFPSLWNQKPREGMHLHWDGNNSSLADRNVSASTGAGATPDTIDIASVQRVAAWCAELPPPKYPFPINEALAAKGEPVYQQNCADCHAFGGAHVGTVIPYEVVGTDPHRLDSFSRELAAKLNTVGAGRPWRISHFRKTDGYASPPLDGIWARAPYLHNGSVPTLSDLLEVREKRPKTFYRGCDVFDQERVGFVSTIAQEKTHKYFSFDTSVSGNANSGHLWGTELSSEDKRALVEYMKRL